jgi:Phosphotransferase enzyme family
MAIRIPTGPQDFTPALLTELVAEIRPGLRVEELIIVDAIGYGDADNTVSVSTSGRVAFDVRYAGPAAALPTRLIAKYSIPPGVDCENPPLEAEFDNEVKFYKRLRPELSDIETPLCLVGHYEESSGRYVLIMEDLRPRQPHFNSIIDDNNVAVLQGMLDQLARLHARYWQTARFKTDLSWVQAQTEGPLETLFRGFLVDHIVKEVKRERFKRELIEGLDSSVAEIQKGIEALKRHQATLPPTFLHGDAHFGNTYVLPNGQCGLLDWQVSARGYLMHDVAYMIQSALTVGARRKHERELLAYYRDRLLAHGVKDAPSLETLWLEFRRSMLYGFYMGWVTAPRENYGLEVCVVANNRTAAACRDHDSMTLIRELF